MAKGFGHNNLKLIILLCIFASVPLFVFGFLILPGILTVIAVILCVLDFIITIADRNR